WPCVCSVGLRKRKKKKVAQNILKFCIAAYNIILSISGEISPNIIQNEAFTADSGLGGATSAYGKEKKKSCSEFSQIFRGSL
ncbi:hypothetical protein P5F20_15170, partial [Clostridium perfringens]|nr:hypothetical protein [Clostridium perfringens]